MTPVSSRERHFFRNRFISKGYSLNRRREVRQVTDIGHVPTLASVDD
jgi:hypothetical protein